LCNAGQRGWRTYATLLVPLQMNDMKGVARVVDRPVVPSRQEK
jgi:hypothetical protein